MIKNNIYTPSNKIIGETRLINNTIEIDNKTKPPIIYIYDIKIINIYNSKKLDIDIALELYNNYNLCINEIASIFGLFYNHVFHAIRYLNKAGMHVGRRNSSYGKKFNNIRRSNISKSLIGSTIINNGINEKSIKKGDKLPEGWKFGRLPFSDEHKYKLSIAGKSGKYLNPSEIAKRAWKNGKYSNVNFKRGIGGFIVSKKINKRIFFRSLLELYYIIYYLEENEQVNTYSYEFLHIQMENGHTYTPDYLINNKDVVELKSYNYIYKQGGIIQETFEYKCEQGKKYCNKHNLNYHIIFDKDINFNRKKLVSELVEKHYLEIYNIEFLEPERVWSKK